MKRKIGAPPAEPVCTLCGPVPPGAKTAMCYYHYSRNFSYYELFLRGAEEQKEREVSDLPPTSR